MVVFLMIFCYNKQLGDEIMLRAYINESRFLIYLTKQKKSILFKHDEIILTFPNKDDELRTEYTRIDPLVASKRIVYEYCEENNWNLSLFSKHNMDKDSALVFKRLSRLVGRETLKEALNWVIILLEDRQIGQVSLDELLLVEYPKINNK